MKKKLFFAFAVALLLSSVVAGAISSETFSQSLYKDAKAVYDYFHGSGNQADASASYDRIYSLLYKDAKDFVLNTNSCKFHKEECNGVKNMNPKNRLDVFCSRDLLTSLGYDACDNCNP